MSPTAWAVLASALLKGQPAVYRNQRALLSPQAPALKETYHPVPHKERKHHRNKFLLFRLS